MCNRDEKLKRRRKVISAKKWSVGAALLIIVSMLLSACGPTPQVVSQVVTEVVEKEVTRLVEGTPVVETVVETQVVEKEVTKVVEVEKVITSTPVPTPLPAGGALKRGGTLNWARNSIPENLDMAWTESNADIWITVNVWEPLVRVDKDGAKIEPALAESWDISDDGSVYTFHLRPGVKFHDGSDMTVEDVVYSLARARDNGLWNWSLANTKTIEAVDDSTVQITLIEPAADFLAGLALFANGIFPQQAFESAESPEQFFQDVHIGTGPFMVDDWVVGEYMVLKKNPYYWDTGEDGEPLPYLDELRFVQVPEDSTRVLQIQSGEVDGTDAVPFSQVEQLKTDSVADLTLWPSTQTYYIFVNHQVAPFDDLNVRLALNYAIDRQALVDAVLYGNGQVATSFMPPASPCWDPNLEGYPYDLEKAKQLIADSKYPDGHTGAAIEVPSGRVIGRDQATILQSMWSKIGINVDVNEIEGALLSDKFRNMTFEAISGYQWTNDVIDPAQQVAFFVVDPALHSGWTNARAVELTEEAATELDQDARCQMYYEVQQIYNEEAVTIPLYHTPFTTFINKDVKGFYQIPLGWLVFKETWIDR
jgi:peptide/nickel transport system substrate-binding protein